MSRVLSLFIDVSDVLDSRMEDKGCSPGGSRFKTTLLPHQPGRDRGIAALEIFEDQDQGAFYLFKLDAQGQVMWDSWHETIESAMSQALLDHGVPQSQWVVA